MVFVYEKVRMKVITARLLLLLLMLGHGRRELRKMMRER